ncbi:MAG: tetratricopeptide repeat protein [Sedimentisphaerales bacterium]|nr:tetratricopeptide repeat protein [Sedimentisphaerales bacterium]
MVGSDGRQIGVRQVIICVCSFFALILPVGCNQQQKAVELYVNAVMHRELDENEKAIEKLNSAVKANKRFSLAYSLLGEIYEQMSQYESSASSYKKATELNPWSFKDYFNLGQVYQIMQQFALAVRAYNRACELKPEHLQAHINAARCFYEIEDYNNALQYSKKAQEIDPDTSEVQRLLGDIYESRKDYSQAIIYYKRALEIDSNNPDLMTSLAVAYLKTDRIKAAKELLNSAIKLHGDNGTAYQYLGYCYLSLRDKAINADEGQSKDPKTAALLLADTYMNKAIENYNKALEINAQDWQALKGLGVAYMLKSLENNDQTLRQKAIQNWRLSLDVKPDQRNRERLVRLIEKYSQQTK